ncbi:hypothetical protein N7526_006238 [Penicillium atrosanguineum]|nr:hypothetical protein N7526_006238 [Penicillium atrosanguineum]
MEVLRTAPEASTFVPIAEHQSRTPSSFHDGPAVLHYQSQRCKVVILERDLVANPALNALRGANAANGSVEDEEKEVSIEDVQTWVTSEKFLFFSPAASAGVSIPYPSISLHAIQRLRVPGTDAEVQGLYMQIATPSAPAEDDEEQCITLTVVPPATESTTDEEPEETPTQMLYNAVSACSNLHPDPVEPGDEDEDESKFLSTEEHGQALFQLGRDALDSSNGDLPPPVEGSSGWITADNMHEFFDEDGNWIAQGEPPAFPLGPGAGTVRERENGEENGEEESDETKWRRTE